MLFTYINKNVCNMWKPAPIVLFSLHARQLPNQTLIFTSTASVLQGVQCGNGDKLFCQMHRNIQDRVAPQHLRPENERRPYQDRRPTQFICGNLGTFVKVPATLTLRMCGITWRAKRYNTTSRQHALVTKTNNH